MITLFQRVVLCCCLFSCIVLPNLLAQENMEETEVYIADVKKSGGKFSFFTPVNISRHAGYDNQPWFSADSRHLYFSSIRGETNTTRQHDIYRYTVKDSSLKQFTDTPESEFSPMVTPEDGQSISVVRVEKDSTQRLWKFDAKGGNPILVLPEVRRIGYYAWIGSSNLALYVIGATRQLPQTLQLAALSQSEEDTAVVVKLETIEAQCGRCFRRIPSSIALSQPAVSYVHRTNDSSWTLKRVNIKNRIVSQLFPVPAGADDYTWTQNGSVIMGQGLKLIARHARKDYSWHEIADFSKALGSGSIKRIVFSPDEKRVAFVISR